MGSRLQEVSNFIFFHSAFFIVADIIWFFLFFFFAFSKWFVSQVIQSFITDLCPKDVPALLHLLQ